MNPLLKNIVYVLVMIVIAIAVFNAFAEKPSDSAITTIRYHDTMKHAQNADTYGRCGAMYHTMNYAMKDEGLGNLALGAFHTCEMYSIRANDDGANLGNPAEYCKGVIASSLVEFESYDNSKLVDTFAVDYDTCYDSLDTQLEVMKDNNIPIPTTR